MAFSNNPYNDKDIENLAIQAEIDAFTASNAGLKYYAKDAIDTMRELTDLNDEQIFDEITSYGVTEDESELLAEMLGIN